MNATKTRTRDKIMATGCGAQIADDAAANGYIPVLLRDNGKTGDAGAVLYSCRGVLAIKTNGDAIWDTQDRDSWADWMFSCGLEA